MSDEKKKPHYTDPGQPGHPDWQKQYGPEAIRRKYREEAEEEEKPPEEPKVEDF